jgi:ABC-type multidrug transport system fused ATPase/permease subunit
MGIILGIVLFIINSFLSGWVGFFSYAIVIPIISIYAIFVVAFYFIRAREEGFILGLTIFLVDLFLDTCSIPRVYGMSAYTVLMYLLSSPFTWYRVTLFPLAGFFGGLLGYKVLPRRRVETVTESLEEKLPKKLKVAFILSLSGTVLLALSGLTLISFIPYSVSLAGPLMVVGSGIILFLLIGILLIMYSSNRGRVIAGSFIILFFSGISFILGSIGLLGFQYLNIPSQISAIVLVSFYTSLILLIIGSINGLSWKPPIPSSQPSPSPVDKELEEEITRLDQYLKKLDELKEEGKISEKAYEKLKEEYEKKLDELISKLKK